MVNQFSRWLNPILFPNGFYHVLRYHVCIDSNRLTKFDVLVGTKVFLCSKVKAGWNEFWHRLPIGLRKCCCGEDRSHRSCSKTNHMGFVVAGSLWKKNTSKPMCNSACEGQQRTAVDVIGFFFCATSSKQFRFPNHRLNSEFSGPPPQKESSD